MVNAYFTIARQSYIAWLFAFYNEVDVHRGQLSLHARAIIISLEAGEVNIAVNTDSPERCALYLRIPGWSRKTGLLLSSENLEDLKPGTYEVVERTWSAEDKNEISFDMSTHLWVGENARARCQFIMAHF